MRKIVTGLLAAAAITAIASGPARADTDVALVDGGGFYTFFFQGVGSDIQDAGGNTIDFTFTLAEASTLYIADGSFSGDQFSVTIDDLTTATSVTSNTSPSIGVTTDYIGDDFIEAFSPFGAVYSHARYDLGPGSYVVTGEAIQSPFFAGSGGIQLGGVVPVPEPAIWAMMLIGFGGLGSMLRRARRASAALA